VLQKIGGEPENAGRAADAVGLTALREVRPRPLGPRQPKTVGVGGPLTPVTSGLSRSLADSLHRRSGHLEARTAQIPKLIVRVRFPSASAIHAGPAHE